MCKNGHVKLNTQTQTYRKIPTSLSALIHLHPHKLSASSTKCLWLSHSVWRWYTERISGVQTMRRISATIPQIRSCSWKSVPEIKVIWGLYLIEFKWHCFKHKRQKWGTLVPLRHNSNGQEWFVIKTTQTSFKRKEAPFVLSAPLLGAIFFHLI